LANPQRTNVVIRTPTPQKKKKKSGDFLSEKEKT
jgi:hypothetical protein